MKYTIADVQQDKLMRLGLDIKDAFILTYIKELAGTDGVIRKIVDEQVYYWIDYQKMLDYMPILSINNIKVIGRRMTEYEKHNLIKRHIHRKYDDISKTVSGGYTFINITENFKDLFEISKVKTNLAEVEEKAREMGLASGGTQKYPQSEPVALESDHYCGHSKVLTIVGTQKCLHNTTNNYTPNNNTTTNKSGSSSFYEFLDFKEFDKLDVGTKNNLRMLKDLNYEEFKSQYDYTIIQDKQNKVKNFNAFLFKAVKNKWTIKTEKEKNNERESIKKITNRLLEEKEVYFWNGEKIIEEYLKRTEQYPIETRNEYLNKLKKYL